jgi:hypothetical protein
VNLVFAGFGVGFGVGVGFGIDFGVGAVLVLIGYSLLQGVRVAPLTDAAATGV